ncbi:hypothetical protein MY5147_007620 [Beauveria neobassiana]|uniref:Glycosyltransferase family 31 protein n=1 Tax=Beauveria bassiana TaxID=176275 RepID=A0A2S7Y1Z5_BEABA|nr:hypothetical protein BB8028_0002g03930 [Beauveria bassiana]
MTQLVASPFSFPRKSISILLISGILAYTFLFLQACDLTIDLLRPFASQQSRNASVPGFDTGSYLEKLVHTHDLSPQVEWAAWNIPSTQNQKQWSSVTRTSRHFRPPRPRIFDQRGGHNASSSPPTTFRTLPLPSPRGWRPGDFDASGYLFGVSTTHERLMENDRAMLRNWQWWLTDGKQGSNGAHIVIMLDRANEEQIQQVEAALAKLGIPAMVYNIGDPLSAATTYAQLAGELHSYGVALSAVGIHKKWFVLIEDAIFFPSLPYLNEKLGAYDAQDSVYIGVPSEREDWTARDGKLSTNGGGVVILSRGGLVHYLSLSCAEKDASSGGRLVARQWTSILHGCMMTRGELPMHVIPGLYVPAADDPTSSLRHGSDDDDLEAGVRPLALRNHRGHARNADIARAYLVADVCGEACFAQRFLFRDGWVLVNGVSISRYQHTPTVQSAAADNRTERRALAAQRQLQEADRGDAASGRLLLTGGGTRKVWRLLDSVVDDDGAVWQAYLRRDERKNRAAGAQEKEVQDEGLLEEGVQKEESEPQDSVIILIWTDGERG